MEDRRRAFYYKLLYTITILLFIFVLFGCAKESEENGITTITLGTLRSNNEQIKEMKHSFEKEYPSYQLEVKEYVGEEGYKRFLTELTAGKGPDIVDLFGLPAKELSSRGMFKDLMGYMENDGSIDDEDIITPLLNAALIDGKLYYTMGSFGINTLYAQKEGLSEKNGWTVEEMVEYVNSLSEDMLLFSSNSREDLFNSLVESSFEDYIDWESGKASFDNDSFRSILVVCKNAGENSKYDDANNSIAELIRDKKICFVKAIKCGAPELIADESLYGIDMIPIGFPNRERKGSSFIADDQFAISELSENKEAAWNCISVVLSKDYQYKKCFPIVNNIPVRKDVFDMYLKAVQTNESYTDDMGNIIYPYEGGFSYSDDDSLFIRGPLTKRETEDFTNLIASIDRICDWDSNIKTIINDEAEKYFRDERTVDETIKVIQNRVETYVAERK